MGHVDIELGVTALAGLLGEFAKGNIVDPRVERDALARHAGALSAGWDARFPAFPDAGFLFTSFRGQYERGKRDAHLKNIITRILRTRHDVTIVNPACVFGQHSRDLASRLERVKVIATDIDPTWNRLHACFQLGGSPENFEFVQDNIFEPQLAVQPTAVVFFGACGSVSDGAMDYAIESRSPYLMCRTCCHDNIGGNTEMSKRPGFMNRFFRLKNKTLAWMRKKEKYAGFYFSGKYSKDQYPRSRAARSVTDSDTFREVSRHSPDSDVCRAIIDLDRYLRLVEQGYRVWYRGELFVAERIQDASGSGSM